MVLIERTNRKGLKQHAPLSPFSCQNERSHQRHLMQDTEKTTLTGIPLPTMSRRSSLEEGACRILVMQMEVEIAKLQARQPS
ncbi:hypothetical protein P3L10_014655 [Capsicum annuum]